MKTTVLCFLFSCFCTLLTAQAPQSFKYQAVARNTTGEVLANRPVSLRISILSGSISGTAVYSEIHQKTTNAFGLVDLEIGKGNSPMGNFNSIDWGGNTFFFKVEMDPAGGTAYQLTGTSQLLSVPYALHAKTVENVATDGTLSGKGSLSSPLKLAPQDAVAGQVLKWNGSGWLPSDDLSGGASAPGGSNGHLQFNSNGVLGGDPGLVWDNTGKRLGIGTGNPAYPLHLTTSGNLGILSESSATDGHGIFGYGSSATGNNTGVLGESASSSGTGVYGNNTATSGATTGVTGNVTSPEGRGVIGSAGAKTGNAIGVVGYSASEAGTGVLGLNDATGGTTLGVSGIVSSPEGYAGFFSGGKFRVESLAMIDSMLSMENHMISNVANPVNPRDAATKEYVDAMVVWIYSLLTSPVEETVRDASGNIYRTVKIGSQVWMAENLKTTKYNDGTAIPLVTDNAAWTALTTPGYCWYNNDKANYGNIYGALYNWFTVNTGKLCPTGWHVPSDEEWTTLTTFLGGGDVAGGKMKETGTTHWLSPNTGATNESGFSALAGGYRNNSCFFGLIRTEGAWWSPTENSTTYAWIRYMNFNYANIFRDYSNKGHGCSVRCVRDNASVTLPTVITSPLTGITQTTSTGGGNVTSDGGAEVTARGVCWSTAQNPTVSDNKTTDGTGTGSFTSSLAGLTAGTQYYVRAYATNSAGTSYGGQVEFTTSQVVEPPAVSTSPVTDITQTTATGGGNVTSDGGAEVTARGVCWSTAQNPTVSDNKTTDGTGTGSFTSSLAGLTAGTQYYVRAYATNSAGTSYGGQVEFTTSQVVEPPAVSTSPVTDVTQTTATGGGNVTSDGGAAVTARGVCWSTSQNPTTANSKTTDGTGTGTFTSSISGLASGTLYYVRAYATNSAGTSYGEQVQFRARNETGSFVDSRDQTVYPWVNIGTQTWMASNLRYLPAISPPSERASTQPYYYVYGYDGRSIAAARSAMDEKGALYNWPASLTACPSGWHLPTDAEWTTLENYMIANGYNFDGTTTGNKIAKSLASTSGWNTSTAPGAPGNDQASNNSSGFYGIPGGYSVSGGWGGIGRWGYWWSSTEYVTSQPWYRYLNYDKSYVTRGYENGELGFSVRCLRGDPVPLPTITTSPITDITQTTATGGGNVTSEGGAAVTARGFCWHTSSNPTLENKLGSTVNGSGTGSFTGSLTGLTAGTLYYVRAYATNSAGTSYGEQVQFHAKNQMGIFQDPRDQTFYPWVKIGSQTWIASNLRYLPAVSPSSSGSSTQPYYYVYGYEGTNVAAARTAMDTKGVWYNWPAALTACPAGYHLPSDDEWNTLENYLVANGYDYDGNTTGSKIAKSLASTTGWDSSAQAATPGNDQASNNSSGFSALPAGYRYSNGNFMYIGNYVLWWSSEQKNIESSYSRSMSSNTENMLWGFCFKEFGLSVRCVRD